MEMYLWPATISFLASMVGLGLLLFLIRNGRIAWHKRLGGLAVLTGFLMAVFTNPHLVISVELSRIIALGILVVLFGLWDDYKQLGWKDQFAFQLALALTLFWMGVRIGYVSHPFEGVFIFGFWASLLAGTVWILLMLNSMNWLDGVDGLSGGVTLISALTIFFLSFKPQVNQPPVAILTMALSGAVLAFLVVNFHPGRIWAGTSGALFFGFILAATAIFAGTKLATTLLVMTIPLTDFVWVIVGRWRAGASIFRGDRRHLHHQLLRHGWSPRKICFFFYGLTIFFATLAVLTEATGKIAAIGLSYLTVSLIIYHFSRKPEVAGTVVV